MEVDLDPRHEQELLELARRAGKTPADLVADLIQEALASGIPDNGTPTTAFHTTHTNLDQLVRDRHVAPVADLKSLQAEFWPNDESADDLITAIVQWRRDLRQP